MVFSGFWFTFIHWLPLRTQIIWKRAQSINFLVLFCHDVHPTVIYHWDRHVSMFKSIFRHLFEALKKTLHRQNLLNQPKCCVCGEGENRFEIKTRGFSFHKWANSINILSNNFCFIIPARNNLMAMNSWKSSHGGIFSIELKQPALSKSSNHLILTQTQKKYYKWSQLITLLTHRMSPLLSFSSN